VLGQAIFVVGVAVACFDLGGPGVVFCGFAANVVRIRLFGFVGEDAFAEELVEVVSRDSGGDAEEDAALHCQHCLCLVCGLDDLQHHDTYAHARLADVALALAAPLEGGAVALVIGDFPVLRTLLDAAAVPHGHGNEGGKPQDGVQGVHSEEGVGVCEALGPRPHGHHGEVDDGG
jgi:hypothetical protein